MHLFSLSLHFIVNARVNKVIVIGVVVPRIDPLIKIFTDLLIGGEKLHTFIE